MAFADLLAALLMAATGESMPLLPPIPRELDDEPANEVNERSAMLGRDAWPMLNEDEEVEGVGSALGGRDAPLWDVEAMLGEWMVDGRVLCRLGWNE